MHYRKAKYSYTYIRKAEGKLPRKEYGLLSQRHESYLKERFDLIL